MDELAKRRKSGTVAVDASTLPIEVDESSEEPSNPVVGLHVIPTGPRCLFDESPSKGKRYLIIGTAEDCDIRIADASISANHCAIVRRRSRVYVSDLKSTNGVWVSGCRVQTCELHDGAVITIGNTSIVAMGRESVDRKVVIAASTLGEFLRKAVEAYGGIRPAADGIGVAYTTLRDWLQTRC